ncbi:MAG TPA: vanadium-dependent haloperoxidase [Terriglobales bacterium]|nr:vanadium-dependent haloperoxidase [Terriglobales bacterium]
MFFVLNNALFDAGIAAWEAKRTYDSVRPITAIPLLFRGRKIRAWGGPGKGTVEMDGVQWMPYQPTSLPTPPFPDYVSGHSAYSAAAPRILEQWTGSTRFENSVTFPAGSSTIETGTTPTRTVILCWETLAEAADQAGMSRRYGGIHFRRADMDGRLLGRSVATTTWSKAQMYIHGKRPSLVVARNAQQR